MSNARMRNLDYVNPWTDERVAQLRQWWDEGLTAGRMREILGHSFTRCAILGKVRRLKLPFRNETQYPNAPKQPRRKPAVKRIAGRPSSPIAPAPAVSTEIPTEHRCTLFELMNTSCRWPIGEPGRADFFFCGAPMADMAAGRPYCSGHMARAYAKQREPGPFRLKSWERKAA